MTSDHRNLRHAKERKLKRKRKAHEVGRLLREQMKELAGRSLITAEQFKEFGLLFDARAELKERLNIRVKSGNPGRPVNWRGLD